MKVVKMWLQGSSDSGRATLEVDAPVSEIVDIPQKLKALGLPQIEGQMRVQIEARINIGSRVQKLSINCGSNDLALVVKKLEPFVEDL